MKPAIEIRQLGKQYTLHETIRYLSLRDVITRKLRSGFRSSKKEKSAFWALEDITLDIMPGERIGIIGRNGAGKSTLLKIISRITPPSTGEALIRGRVGSLLEVGTGFHPELTGRENIYLNGSILGLRKTEIDRQLDPIIDFSGIEKFIDTPLKHYSSGMQMRLAFSVASHLQSEILLIDEVLAVGDLEFQKKCLGKMAEVSRQEGRTVLFVSHNLPAISSLTQKTLLLDQGKAVFFGDTGKAINAYTQTIQESIRYHSAPDPLKPCVTGIELVTSEGGPLQAYNKPLSVYFDIHMPEQDIPDMALSFQVINRVTEQPVLHNWLYDVEKNAFRKKGINRYRFTFPNLRLYRGSYYLRVHLAESRLKTKFQELEDCYFQVEMLNMHEPEWGWYDNMCVYFDEGVWVTE